MVNSPSEERAADGADDAAVDAAAAGAPGDADERDDDPAALRLALEESRAGHQRALADYRNLQRRTEQDRADQARHTMIAVLHNVLPVFDDLNRALDNVDPELAEHRWVEGVRLVRQKFWGMLEASGVSEIPALGERFDPEVHEAVGYAPGADGAVVQLVQSGYLLRERVVRPAIVLVGNGEHAPDAPE